MGSLTSHQFSDHHLPACVGVGHGQPLHTQGRFSSRLGYSPRYRTAPMSPFGDGVGRHCAPAHLPSPLAREGNPWENASDFPFYFYNSLLLAPGTGARPTLGPGCPSGRFSVPLAKPRRGRSEPNYCVYCALPAADIVPKLKFFVLDARRRAGVREAPEAPLCAGPLSAAPGAAGTAGTSV